MRAKELLSQREEVKEVVALKASMRPFHYCAAPVMLLHEQSNNTAPDQILRTQWFHGILEEFALLDFFFFFCFFV